MCLRQYFSFWFVFIFIKHVKHILYEKTLEKGCICISQRNSLRWLNTLIEWNQAMHLTSKVSLTLNIYLNVKPFKIDTMI